MTADTYSASIGAILMGTGNDNNSWGANLNGALSALDLAIAGHYSNLALTGGQLALNTPVPPAGQHPLAQMLVDLGGTLTSNQTVVIPNVPKLWLVRNSCVGAFSLNFMTTGASSSVSAAAIQNPGSGGTNGSVVLTVQGGTGTAATLNGTISGGALTSLSSIASVGAYTAIPQGPVSVLGGGLVGASVNLTMTNGGVSPNIPQGGMCFVWCDGAGNMYVGGSSAMGTVQWLGADGTVANPGISFATEPGTGLWHKSQGILSLVVGGVEIAEISATGINVTTGLALTIGGVAAIPPGSEMNSVAIQPPTGWYFEYGQTIARATDLPLFNAITQQFTATTNATTVLTSVSQNLTGLGLEGSILEGVGMATGATIVSITATTITMSLAATNSAAGGALRACPFGNGDGSTTFQLPDARDTVAAGRDNMGGTALGHLTTAGSNVNALQLNTVAGNQSYTIITANLPPYTPAGTLTVTGNVLGAPFAGPFANTFGSGGEYIAESTSNTVTQPITITSSPNIVGTPQGGTSTPFATVQPTRIRNVLIKR